MGLVATRRGVIRVRGENIVGLRPFQVARLGLGYVLEERRIFSDLTVLENLRLAAVEGARWTPEAALDGFPVLATRRHHKGRHLSGGEQQMLAIARALVGGPTVLMLDEPSQGLAPVIVESVMQDARRLCGSDGRARDVESVGHDAATLQIVTPGQAVGQPQPQPAPRRRFHDEAIPRPWRARTSCPKETVRFSRIAGLVVAVALALVEITAAGRSRSELTAAPVPRQNAGRTEAPADGGGRIPGDLEECFAELKRVLPRTTIEQMQGGSEAEMARHHLGLGMWMRNQWGLWKGSRTAGAIVPPYLAPKDHARRSRSARETPPPADPPACRLVAAA